MTKKGWNFEKMITGKDAEKEKPEPVKKETPPAADLPKEKPAKKRTARKMGRPPVEHGREPFTSRCDPETWAKIKMLAMVEKREPGEIVEAAFQMYLNRHGKKLNDFITS